MWGKILHGIVGLMCIFLLFSVGCTDTTDCKYTANRSIKINFIQLTQRNTLVDTIVQNLSVYTSNGIVLYDSVSAKQIQLPLSQLSDTSIFFFHFDFNIVDTLIIYVTRRIEMISPECGFNTRFTLDSVQYTLNNISKVILVDRVVGENATIDRNLNMVVVKK